MSNRNPFDVEALEPRAFFSVTAAQSHMVTASVKASVIVKLPFPIPASFGLTGTATGSYTRATGIPDTGATYHFTGSGKISPLGADTVTGSLQTPGFILNGVDTGTLTLSNVKGTVTVSVTGPSANPSATPVPMLMLTYTVTGGTGSYKNLKGTGPIRMILIPSTILPPTAFGITQTGHFTFTFLPGVIPLA
jgi:hypothetical protein